ncbi:MDR family NADP-dependent oxidoreductase [Novosphingobium colocasiae]|uniref:MDR family NADP-dependent oxidoreductase n=1 Tax=Novosphingobium colocasiae TaxID=1256513 RepID=UPI00167209B0|nr:NADP-dependent oxidoreductase [Novosphingobium colocasiae]
MTNRQWLLEKHPDDAVTRACFRRQDGPDKHGAGTDGQVLVQWELLLCAPTIRNWISGKTDSYHPVTALGDPVLAPGLGRVIETRNPQFPEGTRLFGPATWQDQQWLDPTVGYRIIPDGISSVDAMGPLGINAITAWCGLVKIGEPKPGDVLLVSGAAGSVGSVVAQIGRIKGCKVIGIAGGAEKLAWLREECGVEHLIDYKHENLAERLDTLCPDGIDIYFDNVGGDMLAQAAARMRPLGRIVLCGQISAYDGGGPIVAPPIDMMRLIYGCIRIEGFVGRHHPEAIPMALADLADWTAKGLIAHREDVRPGFDNLPETLSLLFSGSNQGTLIARICDEAGAPV